MGEEVTTIKGFSVLPLGIGKAVHSLLVKEQIPQGGKKEDSTQLFLVNVPPFSNATNIKKLLKQINPAIITADINLHTHNDPTGYIHAQEGKWVDLAPLSAPDLAIKQERPLPLGCGLVSFLDHDGLILAINSIQKFITSKSSKLVWPKLEPALTRYSGESNIVEPIALEAEIAQTMANFESQEHEASNEVQQMRNIVDEDGFTLVVGSNKKTRSQILGGVRRLDDLKQADNLKQKEKERKKVDFYRFQIRERKKQEMGQLLNKFKKDQEKVKEMRERRKFRPY
ncbi:Rrp7 protein [Martiniozyma asiatica (nom. inval.)]|nr:Rrp7 protein [Martiniozyma asiatica]